MSNPDAQASSLPRRRASAPHSVAHPSTSRSSAPRSQSRVPTHGSPIAGIAAVVLLTGLLSGCVTSPWNGTVRTESSTPTPSSPAAPAHEADESTLLEGQELAVDDAAFGRVTDHDYWWFVVIIDNPNRNLVFPSVSVEVEAVGQDGVILDSSPHYVTLLSGKTAIASHFFKVGNEEIAELNVRVPLASAAVASPNDETGSFTLAQVEATQDPWFTTVSGNVTSNFLHEQSFVNIVVVARGVDGQIVGGESAYVERLPSGGTARFQATFLPPLPDDAALEAFAFVEQ